MSAAELAAYAGAVEYVLLADRDDGTVVRCGDVVAKAHAGDSDPDALAVRIRVAGDPALAGVLLPPLRTGLGLVGSRPVSLWPYGAPVAPDRPEEAPWEPAAELLAALHRTPLHHLPYPLPPMRGPAKLARALHRLAAAHPPETPVAPGRPAHEEADGPSGPRRRDRAGERLSNGSPARDSDRGHGCDTDCNCDSVRDHGRNSGSGCGRDHDPGSGRDHAPGSGSGRGGDHDPGFGRGSGSGSGSGRDYDSGFARGRDRDSGSGRGRDHDPGFGRGRDHDPASGREYDSGFARGSDHDPGSGRGRDHDPGSGRDHDPGFGSGRDHDPGSGDRRPPAEAAVVFADGASSGRADRARRAVLAIPAGQAVPAGPAGTDADAAELARLVRAAAATLPGWARGEGPAPSGGALCHGDLHLGQLVRGPAGGWRLIDVDDLGLGTPAWDLARPAAWYAAGLLDTGTWLRFLDAYRAAGGPAAGPPGSDPWPELDLAARALTVQTAALALAKAARERRRLDDVERLMVEACARIASLPPDLESKPPS
ncbi:phosphotransferase [Streptomyces sp. NPDC056401]|uniref:phosphotransferase family protein n=1 Tax=Streptomyces sp. NPDC056401 TaxID=3345809 RepID=UPI0035D5915E